VAISVFCHNQSHERVELEFRVTDTGIGIHPNTLNDLFSPFTQADGSTTRNFGGTGLGLSISKMLVELMGGKITAQSELGAGSCFSVLLPFQLDPNSKSFNLSAPESKVLLQIADRRTVQGMKKILTQLHITALESREDAALLNNQDHVFIDLQTLSNEHEMLEGLKSRGVRVVLFSQRSAECLNDSRIQSLVSDVIQLPITFLTLYRYFSSESVDGEVTQVIDLGSCRILLVDDNMINREIAKELLEQVNATIDEAENGVEAYEKACSNEYDIVLMDIQMPLMDGYEASSQIGQQLGERAPKIIAMTAKAMDEDRDKAQACGMVGYISKPFDKQQLYQTVHSTWRS
jgi:CheY-like chemotaxis protein